jgi:peptidoglycan/LPS O-acetylase OafA/YrhL
VGLTAIAVAAVTYSGATPFPGSAALLPVLGALAVIRAGTPDLRWAPTRAMRLAPVQYLGDVSYSVYLWHWPLIVLAPFVVHSDGTGVRDRHPRADHPPRPGSRSASSRTPRARPRC